MNADTIELSVIIPCFNAELTLHRAVLSALKQDANLEIIIIDDCSIDRSLYLARELEVKFDCITVISSETNRGPGASRNAGLSITKGEYIAFLDADDWWLPDKARKQIDFMRRYHYQFTYHDYYIVRYADNSIKDVAEIKSPPEARLPDFFYKRNYGMCLTSIVAKSAVTSFRFSESPGIYTEDYYFFLQILRNGVYGFRLSESLGVYTTCVDNRSRNKLRQAYSVLRTNLVVLQKQRLQAVLWFLAYVAHQIYSRLVSPNRFTSVNEIKILEP
jgi:teichuronic acid biosynthesis glycosyltransferase TuaG